MPSVYEVNSVGSAISFLIWTLVVVALTKAIFGSFLAAEIGWWLHRRTAKRHEQIRRLQWEVQHGTQHDPGATRGSPHAARQALTSAEAARKRAEIESLARGSVPSRAGQYFLTCSACQSFWSALLLLLVTRGLHLDAIASALAYSGAAVLLTTLARLRAEPAIDQTQGRKQSRGCPGCGR
jgi:hypothetical protein